MALVVRRSLPAATRVAVVVAMIALVQYLVAAGHVSPLFVAKPTDAFSALFHGLGNGPYPGLLATTLVETAVAFGLAAVLGMAFGYLLWRHPVLGRAYEPFLYAAASSPIVLLYPVALVVVGRDSRAVIVLGAIAGVLPIIISTQQALRQVPSVYLKVAAVLRIRPAAGLREVLLPAALPGIVAGLRLGLTYTLLTVLAMEYLTDVGGIGAEISASYSRLRAPEMYAAMIVVVVLTAIFLYLINVLDRLVARHR